MAIHIHLPAKRKTTGDRKTKDATFREVLNDPDGKAIIEQLEEITGSLRRKGGKGSDPRLEKIAENLVRQLKTKFGYNYGSFYDSKSENEDAGFTTYSPREVARLRAEIKELEDKIKTEKIPSSKRDLELVLAKVKKELLKYRAEDANVQIESMSANDIMEKYGATFLARVERQKEATTPDGKVVKVDGARFNVFDASPKVQRAERELAAHLKLMSSYTKFGKEVPGPMQTKMKFLQEELQKAQAQTEDTASELAAKEASKAADNATVKATKSGTRDNHYKANVAHTTAMSLCFAAGDTTKANEHRTRADFHFKNAQS